MKILPVAPLRLDAFKQVSSLTPSQLEVSYDTMFKTADYERVK
jgi:hypothetical protein